MYFLLQQLYAINESELPTKAGKFVFSYQSRHDLFFLG
jgi:hypothetical protein